MFRLLSTRLFGHKIEDVPAALAAQASEVISANLPELQESTLLRSLGWISAGFGALALGLFVGRELRQRYKFNRRTPYDFYAHSGDERQDIEFGLGI